MKQCVAFFLALFCFSFVTLAQENSLEQLKRDYTNKCQELALHPSDVVLLYETALCCEQMAESDPRWYDKAYFYYDKVLEALGEEAGEDLRGAIIQKKEDMEYAANLVARRYLLPRALCGRWNFHKLNGAYEPFYDITITEEGGNYYVTYISRRDMDTYSDPIEDQQKTVRAVVNEDTGRLSFDVETSRYTLVYPGSKNQYEMTEERFGYQYELLYKDGQLTGVRKCEYVYAAIGDERCHTVSEAIRRRRGVVKTNSYGNMGEDDIYFTKTMEPIPYSPPKSAEDYYRRALIARSLATEASDYLEVAKEYKKVLEVSPGDAEAYYSLGVCYEAAAQAIPEYYFDAKKAYTSALQYGRSLLSAEQIQEMEAKINTTYSDFLARMSVEKNQVTPLSVARHWTWHLTGKHACQAPVPGENSGLYDITIYEHAGRYKVTYTVLRSYFTEDRLPVDMKDSRPITINGNNLRFETVHNESWYIREGQQAGPEYRTLKTVLQYDLVIREGKLVGTCMVKYHYEATGNPAYRTVRQALQEGSGEVLVNHKECEMFNVLFD